MSDPLDGLCLAIEAHAWETCAERMFEVLYPLPVDAGRDVATRSVARYATIFRRNAPRVEWPHELMDDVTAWVRHHGRATGEEPSNLGVADGNWLLCLDALLLGAAEGDDVVVRTAAWATAVTTATSSRALAVWEVDDPEAVILWRAGQLPQARDYWANAPARAALEREWWWVVRHLAAIQARHPETTVEADPDAIRSALARWNEHERRLILPG